MAQNIAGIVADDATVWQPAAFLRGLIPGLEGVAGPTVVLVAAQVEASDNSAKGGAELPVQITATHFISATLTAGSAEVAKTAAAWGYRATALEDQQSTLAATMETRMDNAARVGVATAFLHIKEKYTNEESALGPSCPAAVQPSRPSHRCVTPTTEPLAAEAS